MLTNENKSTKKLINEVTNQLNRYGRGSTKITSYARELLLTELEKLNRKRDILDKNISEITIRKGRITQLMEDMKKEEELILKEKEELVEEKRKFKEQQKLFLLNKTKLDESNHKLQSRIDNQRVRTEKEIKYPHFDKLNTPPITYSAAPRQISEKKRQLSHQRSRFN